MSSYIRDGQPAGLYTQGHTVIHALRAGGLRPLRYTRRAHRNTCPVGISSGDLYGLVEIIPQVCKAEKKDTYLACQKPPQISHDSKGRNHEENTDNPDSQAG